MNLKRLIGAALFIAGIPLMVIGAHQIYEFNPPEDDIGTTITNFFTNNPMWNPLLEFFGGAPQVKPPEHDAADITMLIIGIILVVAGALITLIPWRRIFR